MRTILGYTLSSKAAPFLGTKLRLDNAVMPENSGLLPLISSLNRYSLNSPYENSGLARLGERPNGKRYPHRSVAGHPRHAGPQSLVAGASARIRRAPPHPADFPQPSRNPAGIALSRALPSGARGLDRRRMGTKREQQEGALLSLDRCRSAAPRRGSEKVESVRRRCRGHLENGPGGAMSARSRILTWWRAVTRSAQLEAQVEEELRSHIESYAEYLMRSGLSRHEATRRARAELRSIAARKENCRAAWGTRIFDELGGDLRFAMRMLAKSPGLAAIAIGSLALGIGANTVIFTAAQHMLLDRLRVPHPEQLRLLWWSQPMDGAVEDLWGEFDHDPGGGQRSTSFSYPVYRQLRQSNRDLQDLFAFKPLDRQTVTVNGHAEAVGAEMVSGNYFQALGVLPQLGRAIQDSDDGTPGSSPVVVISEGFWTRHFARSPNAIGKPILVNMVPLTIIGVCPAGFSGAYSAQGTPDIFLPFSMQPTVAPQDIRQPGGPSLLTNMGLWWVLVMGRVNTTSSDRTAEAALNVDLSAAVRATMPAKAGKPMPRLLQLDGSRGQNPAAEGLTRPIYVLMGLSGFVLLLACANLANLLLARAGARQREMSVRLAIGAGRGRILRQIMTESLMLSLLGGVAGLVLAYAVRNAIPRMMSNSWEPVGFSARFDWRIFGFAAGVSAATGLIFGLAPAWAALRVQVSSAL